MRATVLTIILALAAAPTTSRAQETSPMQPTAVQDSQDQGRAANRAAIEQFFSGLEAMDVQRAVGAFAEDGVQVMPYSPEGFPKRLDGRAAILRQYSGLPENYTSMRFPREILATEDPERFVVRYTGEIALKAGGRYDNTYVGLFTVRDGRIHEFVEFFDPIILQKAFGAQLQQNFNVPR